MKAFVAQLPALVGAESRSEDGAPGSPLAVMRYDIKRYGAAARLYAEAFRTEPGLADDVRAWHRYNAACYASLAAAARGEGAVTLDDTDRARLRKQALDWLRADLAAWTKILENCTRAACSAAQETMKHWRQDGDLTGIRDQAGLAKLPAEERALFGQLWADVTRLLDTVTANVTEDSTP